MLLRDSNTKLRYTGLNQLWVTVQMIEQREKSVSAFVSFLLQPPPSPSFVILCFFLHQHTLFSSSSHTHTTHLLCLLLPHLFTSIFSPLLSPTLPFHHPLHPVTKAESLLWLHNKPPPPSTYTQADACTDKHRNTHTYTFSLRHPSYSHSLCLRRDNSQVFERAQKIGDVIQTLSHNLEQHSTHSTKPLLQIIHSTGQTVYKSKC